MRLVVAVNLVAVKGITMVAALHLAGNVLAMNMINGSRLINLMTGF